MFRVQGSGFRGQRKRRWKLGLSWGLVVKYHTQKEFKSLLFVWGYSVSPQNAIQLKAAATHAYEL